MDAQNDRFQMKSWPEENFLQITLMKTCFINAIFLPKFQISSYNRLKQSKLNELLPGFYIYMGLKSTSLYTGPGVYLGTTKQKSHVADFPSQSKISHPWLWWWQWKKALRISFLPPHFQCTNASSTYSNCLLLLAMQRS